MSSCCSPTSYERMFGARTARRDARRYRKKGLDDIAEQMVAFLTRGGVDGQSVLEVGGGVGAIELELLKAGADRGLVVELSSEYEAEAVELAREAGFEGRIERRLGDFVAVAAGVEPADAVVLHRVVCCYPDPEALVGAAAAKARRRLVLSFPRDTRLVRLGFRLGNLWWRRQGFEAFVHPPEQILGAARVRGLEPAFEHRGRLWQLAGLERAA